MKNLIERFNSVNSVKRSLEKEIEDTENTIAEYSNLLGEKIRINDETSSDDPEFLALKEKLKSGVNEKPTENKSNETSDEESDETQDVKSNAKSAEKKNREKPKKSKLKTSDKWYNLDDVILVYNGIGLKGELELYFKAIDELKSKLENFRRTLSTLNNVIEKGLKEDMGCIMFRGSEGILELAFLKSAGSRKKFSYKSIFSGAAEPVENIIKIGV
jgi:hypothetical protein